MKKFTTAEIRDLFGQVVMGEISFSRMVEIMNERVEEPRFKDGDFLHSDWDNENITIICRKINGNHIYYHASKINSTRLGFDENRFWPNDGDFRLATESEKKELIDALAKEGKLWNAEKLCIEDIPKHKFKVGDKIVLKSGYKKSNGLTYLDEFDHCVGRKITVAGYTDIGNVYFSDCPYIFEEDWLEPYEELKEGDLAIFWNNGVQQHASVRMYGGLFMRDYCDTGGVRWDNAIKFESKEQFERLIKGEI